MSKDGERTPSSNRRRRGVVRASITRLDCRITELEEQDGASPGTRLSAQRMLQKLGELDMEFKAYHLAMIDLIEDDALEAEQIVLDEHDDKVAYLTMRVQQLISKRQWNPLLQRTNRIPTVVCPSGLPAWKGICV